jgi:predicted enzyme related to lactoylglutathione lyase
MSSQSRTFVIQPILNTNDIERLSSFYIKLFGAEEHMRVPGRNGPFFVTLRFGQASLPAGGTTLGPAKNMPWRHRVAHITDPDGNTINLTQQL